VIAGAAAKVGKNDDAQAVAAAIKASGPWKTAIGELGYDAKGDITRPDYVLYTWKKQADGSFTYIENE
jgi:branched-chain amino acid transport system substrate-binding protein